MAQTTPFSTLPPFAPTPIPTPLGPEAIAVLQKVEKIKAKDPVADVEKAWQNGDRRLASLDVGVGAIMPGIKQELHIPLRKKYGGWTVCSPGDVMTDEKLQLREVGVQYATRYNQLLLKKLGLSP